MTADTWTDHNWRPKLWTRDAHGKNLNIANKILYRGRVSIIASLIIAEGYEKQNSQHKSILSVLNGSIHRMGSSLWECHYGRAELRFGAPSDQAQGRGHARSRGCSTDRCRPPRGSSPLHHAPLRPFPPHPRHRCG